MGRRRQGRELVVKHLYAQEMRKGEPWAMPKEEFWTVAEATLSSRKFAEEMLKGLLDKIPELDKKISGYTDNWDIERMAAIDRNILRLCFYEMHYREDIPPIVSIDEAVEIAKEYSTEDSGAFVNGILDRAAKDLTRSTRVAITKSQKPS